MKANILILISCCVLVACQNNQKPQVNNSRVESLPYYSEPSFTPNWLDKSDSSLSNFHKISPFSFLNQDGETITEKTFQDKIYITDFFFTICPGICPKMMTNMADLQSEFLEDEDVLLLSHSIMPARDSVPVLKAYADDRGILSHKWHLVTGAQSEIYKMGRQEYFIEEDLGKDKDPEDFLHTENFVLVDKNLHIRGIYNGLNKTSIKQLIADVKTLQSES